MTVPSTLARSEDLKTSAGCSICPSYTDLSAGSLNHTKLHLAFQGKLYIEFFQGGRTKLRQFCNRARGDHDPLFEHKPDRSFMS